MNLKELKEIFRLIEKTDFAEVEIQKDEFFIKVNRYNKDNLAKDVVKTAVNPVEDVSKLTHVVENAPAATNNAPHESSLEANAGKYITSPFVGTFYGAPSPDSENYVSIGSSVKKGQIVCIVEAMKLMNELESEVEGKIKEILVENGQPVEFGQKLFLVD
ncbi:MAG TPA: acetyl-CoA carboxylase biotin carboxyl carrier protein [Oligoflexia bacterium]|nr:acetyl-CoA carboxylase biotin carboxyl carrier protein [Oligoflexia bacterium]HMR25729.1 acetyl-CoA carboxylase biotin carboxyl carrier protein [Oligoflexia bacterium]